MKKQSFAWRVLLSLLLACFCFSLPIVAQEEAKILDGSALPGEYHAWLESIPKEIAELLPTGIFSESREEMGEAVNEISSFSYLCSTLLELIGARLGGCAKILASSFGLLLLSAVFQALRGAFKSEGVQKAFGLCSTLVITLALICQSYDCLVRVTDYFANLNTMTAALLPVNTVLYAMGGNTSTAVASSAGLSVYMTVMEEIVGKTILPFCGICMALALMGTLDSSLRTSGLLSATKKNYTTVLSFLMMLLLAMLSAQSTLGTRADSLAMRSVKFAAGSWIPVVGGSVAELLRTIGAGVGYLRGAVGICGIFLLLFLLLPTLVELFLLRLCWQLSSAGADLLGCEREKKLLEEFASILGYLIAAVSICSSVLLLSLILLATCASAIA